MLCRTAARRVTLSTGQDARGLIGGSAQPFYVGAALKVFPVCTPRLREPILRLVQFLRRDGQGSGEGTDGADMVPVPFL